jgi:hypothetical protein
VYQLVYQLRQDFEAGAAGKCDTCKALGLPAFSATNQKVGSSNLSGPATLLHFQSFRRNRATSLLPGKVTETNPKSLR